MSDAQQNSVARPVVLTFVRYYLPGYKSGGPIRTIANLVEALGDEIDFRIVTSDRDATDTSRYAHLGPQTEWRTVGKAQVLYLSPAQKGLRSIAGIMRGTPHDTLYLNSYFDPTFTVKPLLARRLRLAPAKRCVIAPRGEFAQSALKLKGWKKRMYHATAQLAALYRGLIWQASSDREALDIARATGAADIRVAANMPTITKDVDANAHRPRAPGEPLRICFLSRISPMKNLDYALQVLSHVRAPVRFDIYGHIDDPGYWKRCTDRIPHLPANISAHYHGEIDHSEVVETIARHDLFFLPTRGENFGHAIIEALSGGTPVLISDTTPWRQLADKGIGWDLPLGQPHAFAMQIDKVNALAPAEHQQLRRNAKVYFRDFLNTHNCARDNRLLFGALAPAKTPT